MIDNQAPRRQGHPRRVLDAIYSQPWAIDPAYLPTIIDIAERELSDKDLAGEISALRSRSLGVLDGTETARVENGVAVIPLVGPIFPRANMLTALSGATSLELFMRDLRAADKNEAINQILIDIDSPGGVASGIAEAAELLSGLDTPTTAYIGGQGSSAAYWLAAATGQIAMHPSAFVGSIGIVTAGTFQEAPDQQGERTVEIVSSNAPNKRPDLSTPEGVAVIRANLDALEEQFIQSVALGRGVSTATVISDFGRGGALIGAEAVRVGMADRTGDFETILAMLSSNPAAPSGGAHQSERKASTMPTDEEKKQEAEASTPTPQAVTPAPPAPPAPAAAITAEAIQADHPAIADHFRDEGAKAERARLAGIEAAALPGHEKLVAQLKADGKSTPGEAALAILAAEKQTGARKVEALAQAGAETEGVEAGASADGASVDTPAAPAAEGKSDLSVEEKAKADWEASAKTRAEHLDRFENFLALRKAEAAGNVRILGKGAA